MFTVTAMPVKCTQDDVEIIHPMTVEANWAYRLSPSHGTTLTSCPPNSMLTITGPTHTSIHHTLLIMFMLSLMLSFNSILPLGSLSLPHYQHPLLFCLYLLQFTNLFFVSYFYVTFYLLTLFISYAESHTPIDTSSHIVSSSPRSSSFIDHQHLISNSSLHWIFY